MTTSVHHSICRVCTSRCAILVHVDDGRVTKVVGDRDDPMYGGYTCVKGRTQSALIHSPDRLLHSQKRNDDGSFSPIPIGQALDEIAVKLVEIRSRYGPRAIAGFSGHYRGGLDGPELLYDELFELLGSEMVFTPNTIDKGGKQIAAAMHGWWQAPWYGFDRPNVALLVGANPLVTYTGLPTGSPQVWLSGALRTGMELIIIDPRATEIAKRATIHLCAKPGHDPEILAAMVHVILAEGLEDAAFLAENVDGVEALRAAVAGLSPAVVGPRAGLDPAEIVHAARVFGEAARGYAFAGTGPSMAGDGTLTEYLVLVLETLCGHWKRAGDEAVIPAIQPTPNWIAQAESPQPWIRGDELRVRSLHRTVSGMPTAALTDEILLPGEGQVRALISWGGNPAVSFPDQLSVLEALDSLELLVQLDPWMSATSRLADYVIAPTMSLEVPGIAGNLPSTRVKANGYGGGHSYANYTPPILERPEGSDVIEEWRFFQGLYTRIHALLAEQGEEVPSFPRGVAAQSSEEVLDITLAGSRIALDEVRAAGRGSYYPASVVVAPKEPGWTGRLDVGNLEMVSMLEHLATDGAASGADDEAYPYRLLCRRTNHVYNSAPNVTGVAGGRQYNPAFMNPDDLAELGVGAGDRIRMESSRASVPAIVEPDPTMRRGTVALEFGFGNAPRYDDLVAEIGTTPNRLIPDDEVYDPYIGQPRMSNLPVRIVVDR